MVFIKKLSLNNFECHKKLDIEFSNGVNAIIGETDHGKSSIRRAIMWCLFNETVSDVIRHGSKKCSVRVDLNNNIGVERIRSASINRYILHKDGEETQFDAVGRGVPEEIQKEVQLYPLEFDKETINLNSSAQITLPFLFDKSPSFRMKLFNKLTGNDLLDSLFYSFNKDVRSLQKEIKHSKEEIGSVEEKLSNKTKELKEKEKTYLLAKKLVQKLTDLDNQIQKIENIKIDYDKCLNNLSVINEELKPLKKLDKLPDFEKDLEKYIKLNKIKEGFDNTFNQLESVKEKIKSTVSIAKLEKEIKSVDDKLVLFSKLSEIKKDYDKTNVLLDKVNKDYEKVKVEVKDLNNKEKELKSKIKVCDKCGQVIK